MVSCRGDLPRREGSPLLALDGEPSPFIDDCVAMLRETGHEISIEQVPNEFQHGANRMLRFRKTAASA
jgi:hypothetical protein